MKTTTSCGASWMRKAAQSSPDAEGAQVFVEDTQPGRQGERLNARCFGAFGQRRQRHVAGGIGVAGDVEPAQRQRE
jgi:hypothetical protein